MRLIREEKDFIRDAILLMLPMILQNFVTFSMSMADTFMVGVLGETALAAVTSAITASWLLLTRPRSPNVQKTTAATWESSAKYCTIVVPAVNSADKATPSSTMLSGVISRTRDKRRITTVESIAPANAKSAVVTGSAVETPSYAADAPAPPAKTMIASEAPNAAPCEMPSVLAEASGLRRTLW